MKLIYTVVTFAVLLASAITASAQRSANFNWTLSTTTDVTSQTLSCSPTSGGPYTPVAASIAPGTSAYSDTVVVAGQTYYCVVTATDPSGTSLNSNQVAAVIPGAPPPPPASSVFLRYGSTASYVDPSANTWKPGTCSGSTATVTHAIAKTTTQPLYQAECYAKTFTLKVTGLTASASYTLTGKFAETYWTAAGSRVFSVTANGAPWLTNFDIFKDAGGEFIADDKTLAVTADSTGAVTLAFTTTADNAKIDALSLVPSGPAPPPPTLTLNCPAITAAITYANIPQGTPFVATVTSGGATASCSGTLP